MKKRTSTKLSLNRATVRSLDELGASSLHQVAGASGDLYQCGVSDWGGGCGTYVVERPRRKL